MVRLHVAIALALLAASAIVICACERPFVEPQRPTLEIVAPDLDTVVSDDSITLIVRVQAFGSVESVSVDGQDLAFDEDQEVWTLDVSLHQGLNRLLLSALDSEGQTVEDTAYAFRAVLDVTQSVPVLPAPRGGHTATLLQDGSVFILGGSPGFGDPARTDGVLFNSDTDTFQPILAHMLEGRSGHTATLLPDGKVLIVGGSRRYAVASLNDLIETVEIFDPGTREFAAVPFGGLPIRRAYHTAVLRREGGDVLIDLFGGEGDIQYTPSPLLGTRNDVRSFELRNDSLIARSPAPGPNLGFSFAGHTQTPLGSATGGKMLIAGATYAQADPHNFAATIDYGSPSGLQPQDTSPMHVARTHHAAEMLQPGQVLVVGGYQGDPASSLNDAEIYSDHAGRFFRFPQSSHVERRFGLSATKLPDERILLLGGFTPSGAGVTILENIQVVTP